MDPNTFNAEYQATQRLGGAISDTAAQLAQVQFNLQAAKDYKDNAQADIAMSKAWDDYQANLNPSSDETKWGAEWQKKLDSTVNAVIPPNASSATREAIALSKQKFSVKSGGDVAMQAKANGVEKAKVTGLTRVNQQWINGDAEGAQQSLTQMANMGLIYHEQIPDFMKKGMTAMEKQNADRFINQDPIAATSALEEQTPSGRWKNFTHLSENDRLAALKMSRQETTALRTSTYNDLAQKAVNDEPATPEELAAHVSKGTLTATQAKTYKRTYIDGQYKASDAEGGALLNDISNYDPTTDADKTGFMALSRRIATDGLPPVAITQANDLLKKKANPKDELNSAAASEANQIIGENFRLGVYGKYENKVKIGDEWVTKVDQATLDKAQTARASVQTAVNQFIKANPNATAMQIKEVIRNSDQGFRINAAWSGIIDGNTGSVP